jgi:hypothetical protein
LSGCVIRAERWRVLARCCASDATSTLPG